MNAPAPQFETDIHREKRGRLTRMKVAAGLLLIVLVALYLMTFFLPMAPGVQQFLRATAGAGVVGGLADWFAVVALFRHPLGIPIPHTALLPRNQKRVAANVGSFIEEHFLIPENIARKIETSRVSETVADWLVVPRNKKLVAGHLANALAKLGTVGLPETLTTRLKGVARRTALSAGASQIIADEIAKILRHGAGSDGVTAAIGLLSKIVAENRRTAEHMVRERSRWWISPQVDKGVAQIGVKGVLSVIDELADDQSDLRKAFDKALLAGIDRLRDEGLLGAFIEQAIRGYADSDDFEAAIERMIAAVQGLLAEHFQSDEFSQAIEEAVGSLAEFLQSDPDTRSSIDRALSVIAGELVAAVRPSIGQYVAETISGWEPADLVERFEAEAGTDLQFIRINGSVLGCVIGGALFTIERVLT